MRVKYYIANIPKHNLASELEGFGFAGTIYDAIGFGGNWDIEDGCVVEMFDMSETDIGQADKIIKGILLKYREQAFGKVVDDPNWSIINADKA